MLHEAHTHTIIMIGAVDLVRDDRTVGASSSQQTPATGTDDYDAAYSYDLIEVI